MLSNNRKPRGVGKETVEAEGFSVDTWREVSREWHRMWLVFVQGMLSATPDQRINMAQAMSANPRADDQNGSIQFAINIASLSNQALQKLAAGIALNEAAGMYDPTLPNQDNPKKT